MILLHHYTHYLHCIYLSESPTITHPTTAYASYNEGSAVNLSCLATGKPDPDVRWVHNGQVKSSGSNEVHLSFAKISKDDAGIYTCRAKSTAGKKKKELNLVVNCK